MSVKQLKNQVCRIKKNESVTIETIEDEREIGTVVVSFVSVTGCP